MEEHGICKLDMNYKRPTGIPASTVIKRVRSVSEIAAAYIKYLTLLWDTSYFQTQSLSTTPSFAVQGTLVDSTRFKPSLDLIYPLVKR